MFHTLEIFVPLAHDCFQCMVLELVWINVQGLLEAPTWPSNFRPSGFVICVHIWTCRSPTDSGCWFTLWRKQAEQPGTFCGLVMLPTRACPVKALRWELDGSKVDVKVNTVILCCKILTYFDHQTHQTYRLIWLTLSQIAGDRLKLSKMGSELSGSR